MESNILDSDNVVDGYLLSDDLIDYTLCEVDSALGYDYGSQKSDGFFAISSPSFYSPADFPYADPVFSSLFSLGIPVPDEKIATFNNNYQGQFNSKIDYSVPSLPEHVPVASPLLPSIPITIEDISSPIPCMWTSPPCHLSFPDEKSLHVHLTKDHIGRKSTNNLCLTCHWASCGVAFKKRDHAVSHIKKHVELRLFQCDYCNKKYKHLHDLKKHLKKCEVTSAKSQRTEKAALPAPSMAFVPGKFTAIKQYTSISELELSASIGDIINIKVWFDNSFGLGTNVSTGIEGIIHSSFIQFVSALPELQPQEKPCASTTYSPPPYEQTAPPPAYDNIILPPLNLPAYNTVEVEPPPYQPPVSNVERGSTSRRRGTGRRVINRVVRRKDKDHKDDSFGVKSDIEKRVMQVIPPDLILEINAIDPEKRNEVKVQLYNERFRVVGVNPGECRGVVLREVWMSRVCVLDEKVGKGKRRELEGWFWVGLVELEEEENNRLEFWMQRKEERVLFWDLLRNAGATFFGEITSG